MKKKSIFRQMIVPMMTVICVLAAIILIVFITAYEEDIYSRNRDISNLLAGEISVFMDGAYFNNGDGYSDAYFGAVREKEYLFRTDLHTRNGWIADGAFPGGAGRPVYKMVVCPDYVGEKAVYIKIILFCCDRNALRFYFLSDVPRGGIGRHLCGGFEA